MHSEWEKDKGESDCWSKRGPVPASSAIGSRSQVSAPLIPKYESFASAKGTGPKS